MRGEDPMSGTSARVPGHTLWHEGRILTYHGWGSGEGKGLCSCGEQSPALPTTAARQRWHREHKQAVLDAQREAKLR